MKAQPEPQLKSTGAAAASLNAEPAESSGFFSKLASAVGLGSKAKKAAAPKRRASIEEMDRNLSCEEMDSDDLGGDLNLSDCEDGQEERMFRK